MFFRFSNQSVKTSLGKCRAAETWLPLFRNYLGNSFTNFQFIHEITAIFMLQISVPGFQVSGRLGTKPARTDQI